ncbi:MAG TPA: ABC transporter ATP-binding protein [Actinomycetota bacterium]|nr:ABC transporter ATP-binding protein [Actinomycetota bacterium]
MTVGLELTLDARGVSAGYRTHRGVVRAVDDVDLQIRAGEAVGLVGESGCGKSTLGRAIIGILPEGGFVEGSVMSGGRDLSKVSTAERRKARGEDVALVFQEPMTRLDPLMRVSDHFVEMIRAHRPDTSKDTAREMAREVLKSMGIPPTRLENYPHEFSGGMRQRIMIALGIVLRPRLVIADEPTTALDVIVEAQILSILEDLKNAYDVGLLLITHNLGIVARTCERVAVMYAGKIVEIGSVDVIFSAPKHPYTQGLLKSLIHLDTTELSSIPGAPPDLLVPPPGCRFAPRCPQVMPVCTTRVPNLTDTESGQAAACYLYPDA